MKKLTDSGEAAERFFERGFISPMEVTADFVYLRLHGPAGKYQGRYSTQGSHVWHERLEQWVRQSLDVFCYFDNDEGGLRP